MQPRSPQRLVSLCPSITETLHALGVWSAVVGRTQYCVHPEGLVEAVPHVGGTKQPDLDRILSLAPDLVLLNEEENRREDAEALQAAGVPVASYFPRDLVETAAYLEALGRDVGAPEEGARLAARLSEALAAPRPKLNGLRHVYLIWRKPWMAVGPDTFISRLLAAAGFENLLGEGERYPELTAEDLAALDPDVVLLSSEPYPFAARHRQELSQATGLPEERLVLVDGQLLSWHGVRTLAGLAHARELAERLATPPQA